MKTSWKAGLALAGLAAVLAALPAPSQSQTKPGKGAAALQERGRAMQQLAEDNGRILANLKTLTPEQKHSVVALMAVTRAAAVYESRFLRPDDTSLRALYGPLSQFSPAYRVPGDFLQDWRTACFDESVSCASAQAKCRSGGKSEAQCDRDFGVIEACSSEIVCTTNLLTKLHKGIPGILGGRNPWPPKPRPFPY